MPDTSTYEFRSAKYSAANNSAIDLEIDHPELGWIWWTAVKAHGGIEAEMFDAAVAAGDVADYVAPAPVVTDSVSARQFKVQLVVAGIKDQVDAWAAQQSAEIQMAYEYSGSFLRSEPMMQAGFQALGFTDAQIDAFFSAAAAL